jgi:hypothetical protein
VPGDGSAGPSRSIPPALEGCSSPGLGVPPPSRRDLLSRPTPGRCSKSGPGTPGNGSIASCPLPARVQRRSISAGCTCRSRPVTGVADAHRLRDPDRPSTAAAFPLSEVPFRGSVASPTAPAGRSALQPAHAKRAHARARHRDDNEFAAGRKVPASTAVLTGGTWRSGGVIDGGRPGPEPPLARGRRLPGSSLPERTGRDRHAGCGGSRPPAGRRVVRALRRRGEAPEARGARRPWSSERLRG